MYIELEGTVTFMYDGRVETQPITWRGDSPPVVPLRLADYPALAEIWENDEDDEAFAEEPA